MDIIKILSDVKGKALDAVHFELLKSAYELQNQNIEQLKNNNEALKESFSLLREKTKRLEKENYEYKKFIEAFKRENTSKKDISSPTLTEVANAILSECLKDDETEFVAENMIARLQYSKIQIKAALDELSKHKLIQISAVSWRGGGTHYYLTSKGKQFILSLKTVAD